MRARLRLRRYRRHTGMKPDLYLSLPSPRGCDRPKYRPRAYPLLMESKAGSKSLLCRASLSENRFALFRTHSSVTDRCQPALRHPFAGSLFYPWSAQGPPLIGSEETRPANLTARDHGRGVRLGLASSTVPALGLRFREGWCRSPLENPFTVSRRARLGGIEGGLIPPHPVQDHRELAGKGNLGLLHPGPFESFGSSIAET